MSHGKRDTGQTLLHNSGIICPIRFNMYKTFEYFLSDTIIPRSTYEMHRNFICRIHK